MNYILWKLRRNLSAPSMTKKSITREGDNFISYSYGHYKIKWSYNMFKIKVYMRYIKYVLRTVLIDFKSKIMLFTLFYFLVSIDINAGITNEPTAMKIPYPTWGFDNILLLFLYST